MKARFCMVAVVLWVVTLIGAGWLFRERLDD